MNACYKIIQLTSSSRCLLSSEDFVADQVHGFKAHHPAVGRVTEYVVSSEERLNSFPIAANWSLIADSRVEERKKVCAEAGSLLLI